MLNIASVLEYIKNGVQSGDSRYVVIGDEHVLDTNTGIKLHIYDDWFKLTHNDVVIATMRDFDTTKEQPVIWQIKHLITSPEVIEQRKANYLPDIKKRREELSYYFENPTPVQSKHVVMEDDTEEYTG